MAISLAVQATILIFRNDNTAAVSFLGFSFLFTILILLSKFKRFDGFGFKAEMWEQELEKAHTLVSQLEALSALVVEQLALISSDMGLASGGPTLAEHEALLSQLKAHCDMLSYDEVKKSRLVKPLINRICYSLCWSAEHSAIESLTNLKSASNPSSKSQQIATSGLAEVRSVRDLIYTDKALYIDKLIFLVADLKSEHQDIDRTILVLNGLENRLDELQSSLRSTI